MGKSLRLGHRRGRSCVVPVVARGNNRAASDAGTVESKVARAERTVGVHDFAEHSRDVRVVGCRVTRVVADGVAEGGHDACRLLDDDGLDFNFANLLEDDPIQEQ